MKKMRQIISALLAAAMIWGMCPIPMTAAASEEIILTVPEEAATEAAVSAETVLEDPAAETTMPLETVPEETAEESMVSMEELPVETIEETAAAPETVPEETVEETTVATETAPEETIAEETVPEETVREEATRVENMLPGFDVMMASALYESEPNNGTSNANPMTNNVLYYGELWGDGQLGDQDCFSFTLTEKSDVEYTIASTSDSLNLQFKSKEGNRIKLELVKAENNIGGFKYAASYGGLLEAGTYYVFLYDVLCYPVAYANGVSYQKHTHDYQVTTHDPTCTSWGYRAYKCVDCGDYYTKTTEAPLPHTEVPMEDIQVTCSNEGQINGVKCSVCDRVVKEPEIIPMLPHTTAAEPDREATCTDPAMTDLIVCQVCRAIISCTETAPALGHDFVQFICNRCDCVDSSVIVEDGVCGDNIRWVLDKDKNLYLVGSGPMYDYEEKYYALSHFPKDIASVTITDGITSIGDRAFRYSSDTGGKIKWVEIPDSVTRIGAQAFEFCSGLSEIHIPSSVKVIGDRAFASCRGLTDLNIPEGVISLGESAFSGCTKLANVVIPDSVTSLGSRAFAGCNNLDYIYVGDGVSVIPPYCFYNAGAGVLTDTPPQFSLGSNIKVISEYAFSNCPMVGITIPEGCTEIEPYGFYQAWKMTWIALPGTLKTIGSMAFHGVYLEDVYYGGTQEDWSRVSTGTNNNFDYPTKHYAPGGTIGSLKWRVSEETLFITGSGAIPDYTASNKTPWYSERSLFHKIIVGESVTGIGNYAFGGLTNVKEIRFEGNAPTFGGSNVFSGVTATAYHAYGAKNWTDAVRQNYGGNITWAKSNPQTLNSGICGSDMEWKFDESGTLYISGSGDMTDWQNEEERPWYEIRNEVTTLVLGNGIRSVGDRAFYYFAHLTSVTLPPTLTHIGDYAFANCSRLVEFPEMMSVKEIGEGAFSDCYALKEVVLPESLTKLGKRAFYYGNKLNKIVIPAGVTEIPESLCENSFYLTTVVLHDGITAIGDKAFSTCNLTEIALPAGLRTIGDSAFRGNKIEKLTFKNDLRQIGANAFADCSYVKELQFFGNAPEIASNAFASISARAFYPMGDETWTAYARGSYGGHLTWVAFDKTVVEEGSCGKDLTWTINQAGILRIYGSGSMDIYGPEDAPWKSADAKITSVVLEKDVASISPYAFSGMRSITQVTAESVKTIGEQAFAGCTAMESMTLPITLESIGENALATESDMTIDYAGTVKNWHTLYPNCDITVNCSNGIHLMGRSLPTDTHFVLTKDGKLTLWGNGAVSDAEGALNAYAAQISTVVIEEGVTAFTGFSELPRVEELTIPSTLTTLQVCFLKNGYLKKIHIPGIDTWCGLAFLSEDAAVPTLLAGTAQLYMKGEAVTDVVIPETVTELKDNVFYGATQLNTITIPATVTYVSATAFEECNAKLQVIYEGTMDQWIAISESSVPVICADGTLLGNGVCGDDLTWKILADGTLQIYGQGAMYDFVTGADATENRRQQPWKNVQGDITRVVLPEGITYIGERAFYGCDELLEIVVPAGVEGIGAAAFHSCYKLKKLALPMSLKQIGKSAFSSCFDLTELTIGNIDSWCSMEFGDEYSNPMLYTQSFCLPGEKTPVTSFAAPEAIGSYAFYGCTMLKEVIVPVGAAIGRDAFANCGDLTLYYQGDYDSWVAIGYSGAIRTVCADGTTILGRGVVAGDENIHWEVNQDGELRVYGKGDLVIGGAYSAPWRTLSGKITAIEIGAGITSVPEGAFSNVVYEVLERVIIGADVVSIADNALGGGGSQAKTYIFRGCPANIGKDNFQEETAWIYYRSDDGWTIEMKGQYSAENLYWIHYEKEEDIENGGPVRIVANTNHLAAGSSLELRAELFGQNGYSLKWVVDDTRVATITPNGRITAKNVTQMQPVTVTLIAYPKAYGTISIPDNTDAPEAYLPNGSMYNKMIFYIHPKATAVQILDNTDVVQNSKTVDIDMLKVGEEGISFRAVTLPEDALNTVNWTVSDRNQQYADYEIDNETGVLTIQNLRNVGTVTLTAKAADGSARSANIRMNILYLDTSRSLTAKANVPSIGLQPGEKAYVQIYGTNKEQPLDGEHFTFTSSDETVATVEEDGTVIGGDVPGTATITATVNADPLKRKATLRVKVISAQTEQLLLVPENQPDVECEWVDETAGYVLHMDKDTDYDRSFVIVPTGEDYRGMEMTFTQNSLRWTSSDTRVATVKNNADGTATVTVKKNTDGACVITATTTDLAKKEAEIGIHVRDYSPRLENSNLTLNAYLNTGTSVGLVESYGNQIAKDGSGNPQIQLYEYDAVKRTYTQSSRLFAQWESGILTIGNTQEITGALQVQMEVTCENGVTYSYNLRLMARNSFPVITTRQSGRINTFLRSSTTQLFVTAQNAVVTDVQVYDDPKQAEHYALSWDGEAGCYTLGFSEEYLENPSVRLNNRLTLLVYLEGYQIPVTKVVTVSASQTKPNLVLSQVGSTINTALMAEPTTAFYIYDQTNKENLSLLDWEYTIRTSPDVACMVLDDHRLQLTLEEEKSTTAQIIVEHENWMQPISLTHRITVQTRLPSVGIAKANLQLNTVYTDETAATAVILDQANLQLAYIDIEPQAAIGTDAWNQADKLEFDYIDGQLCVEFSSFWDLPKPGTYTFQYTPVLEDGTILAAGNIRVTVHTTLPSLKVSNTNLKLNQVFSWQTASAGLELSDTRLALAEDNFVITERENTPAYREAQKIWLSREGDTIVVGFADPEDPAKPGSYNFRYVPVLESGEQLKPVTLRVTVGNTMPRISFVNGNLRLNKFLTGHEINATDIRITNEADYTFAGFAELLNDNWTEIASGIEICYHEETKQIQARLTNATAGRATVKLTPVLLDETTGQVAVMPGTITLNVQTYDSNRIMANIAAKGKLDLMDLYSMITYTVNSISNAAGTVENFRLEGQDAQKFDAVLELDGPKPIVVLKLKDDERYATNVTYKATLVLEVCGQEICNEVSIRVGQSSLRFAVPQMMYYYQSQNAASTAVIRLMSPETALEDAKISMNTSKTAPALVRAIGNDGLDVEILEDGNGAQIVMNIPNTERLIYGRSYTLVLDVTPANNAENLQPTQVSLTVRIMK